MEKQKGHFGSVGVINSKRLLSSEVHNSSEVFKGLGDTDTNKAHAISNENNSNKPPQINESIKEFWTEPYGDRRQQLVFIGIDLNKDDLQKRLEACLLTEEELALGEEAWQKYHDPIHPWELIEEEEFELEEV